MGSGLILRGKKRGRKKKKDKQWSSMTGRRLTPISCIKEPVKGDKKGKKIIWKCNIQTKITSGLHAHFNTEPPKTKTWDIENSTFGEGEGGEEVVLVVNLAVNKG